MAATSITPMVLSGSTNGRGIKVAATATPGTTLHTATSTSTELDEITLYANNSDSTDRLLTIELGGVTSPDDLVQVTVPAQSGWNLIVSGHRLKGGVVVKAFAATANVIVMFGEVNRIVTT